METDSIYQFVKNKLTAHGAAKTRDGSLTLEDQNLFKLFVELERMARLSSFDGVQRAAQEIEKYLVAIGKRQLMAFVYLYLTHYRFTPKITERDENLSEGRIRKSYVFLCDVSNEERLIGLWAKVKYDQDGQRLLQVVYAGG